MKDFPTFTTEYGIASLTLSQIPCRQEGYVRIQAASEPGRLLGQCVDFCRACGAERVYGAGEGLPDYPLHTRILELTARRRDLLRTEAVPVPVTEASLEEFRSILNQRMRQVPNAAWMTAEDGKKMLSVGDGYWIHRAGKRLGLGRAAGDTIGVLAAICPGSGADVVAALAARLTGQEVRVTVADANRRAMELYRRLGFEVTEEKAVWYQVFPDKREE